MRSHSAACGAEISLRRGGAGLAHRGEPGAVARDRRIGGIEPLQQRARHRGAAAMLGQAEEGPGALAEALHQPGLGQKPQMARDARLRLAQDVGEVGDGQLGLGQQRQHAQARLLARRLEGRIEGIETEPVLGRHMGHFPLYKDIFIPLIGVPQGLSRLHEPFAHALRARARMTPEEPRNTRRTAHDDARKTSASARRSHHRAAGAPDAGVYFIGRIRTPWTDRDDCPKNARGSDAVCTVELDPRCAAGLKDVETCSHLVLLYWMDKAPRNLVLQMPGHYGAQPAPLRCARRRGRTRSP